jgi:hypothetical protein
MIIDIFLADKGKRQVPMRGGMSWRTQAFRRSLAKAWPFGNEKHGRLTRLSQGWAVINGNEDYVAERESTRQEI